MTPSWLICSTTIAATFLFICFSSSLFVFVSGLYRHRNRVSWDGRCSDAPALSGYSLFTRPAPSFCLYLLCHGRFAPVYRPTTGGAGSKLSVNQLKLLNVRHHRRQHQKRAHCDHDNNYYPYRHNHNHRHLRVSQKRKL